MKLIDGIRKASTVGVKHTGSPYNIPGSPRTDFINLLKELNLTTGVEVGVHLGEFTEKFCQAGIKIFAIDPWVSFYGAGKGSLSQDAQDDCYERTKKLLAKYTTCTIIRKASMEAVGDFENESLDFAYIDGNHMFRYVAEDLSEWYWKVKKGGILAGHDYFATPPFASSMICHVEPVVNAFVKTYGIEKFYTFGLTAPEKGARIDMGIGWMFFKPD